jgi:uncharacterized coiled-coil protein SlyX
MSDLLEKLSKRIVELEQQAAFQDELHDNLNAVVARQDGEIRELKRQFSMLSERMKEISDLSAGVQQQDETPPHY